jgi:hypothetical protein
MGKECCYNSRYKVLFPEESIKFYCAEDTASATTTSGFASIQVTAKAAQLNFYDQNGDVLYAADPILPRTQALMTA